MRKETFTPIISSISVILGMSSSFITNITICLLHRGRLNLRDIQNGLLAGLVVVGSSSYYITNLGLAVVCGFAAGILYPLFYNLI